MEIIQITNNDDDREPYRNKAASVCRSAIRKHHAAIELKLIRNNNIGGIFFIILLTVTLMVNLD